jgi:hypothetical protein
MSQLPHVTPAFAWLIPLALMAGCFGPERADLPNFKPDKAAAAAMEMFDADGDGAISGEELDKSPGIKSAMQTIDANSDGSVSRDELTARIGNWLESKIGVAPAEFTIKQGKNPVGNADVTLEPEPFLTGILKTATGRTDIFGVVAPLSIPGGMEIGLYRVKVSQKDQSGQERLPSKFNSETTLGVEVHSLSDCVSREGGEVIQLK